MSNQINHHEMANAIRALSIDAIETANSGHPGLPLGMADVATVLFSEFLNFDAKDPDWINRDRFILSGGHGSMLLYSLLYLLGYEDMSLDEISFAPNIEFHARNSSSGPVLGVGGELSEPPVVVDENAVAFPKNK